MPAALVVNVDGVVLPVMFAVKSAAVALPPLAFTTLFITLKEAVVGSTASLFVIVQNLTSPEAKVPLQSADKLCVYPARTGSAIL